MVNSNISIIRIPIFTLLIGLLFSCQSDHQPDAFGNFEAIDVLVSAEQNGKIVSFNLEEGELIEAGKVIGYIDTTQLYLQKRDILARMAAVEARMPEVASQIQVLDAQLNTALKERKRVETLLQAEAATTKELDNILSQISVIEKQKAAMQANLNTQTRSLIAELEPLRAQMDMINFYIEKSVIISPIKGTVLSTYVEPSEFANIGKPLFKVADLTRMSLKAYISGEQLSQVQIGQKVKVFVDVPNHKYKQYEGTVTQISSKSEFTPKTVQTKEERVNLVYAMKIKVINDGAIKVGMPGEVLFDTTQQ